MTKIDDDDIKNQNPKIKFKKGAFYIQPLETDGSHYETTENSD